jgi:Response regulator containing CheY-like receiver, AAA-type ATPase, and DNA-binding domains
MMVRKIMVVEDDQPILDLMDLLIRKLGYEPVLIADGLGALELITKESPALILLDIMMTPINGWEFLEKLRGEYGLSQIPVILFTASPMIKEKMEELQDPYLDMLIKPVSFADLKAGIAQYLE